ncbi:MAG: glycosyltransferase family 2 protein [Collinsella sp.]|nr:glycosyltransferase family 2 protein [Collinsella sp.]
MALDSTTLISVIIPAYQAERTIERAVSSALSIPYDAIEVIVVDDGSTDGTAGILDAVAAGDHRVRLVRQENRGRSVARNKGFSISRGEWVMFLDSDDFLLPEAFDSMLERAENSTSSLVVFGMKRSDGLDQFGGQAAWGPLGNSGGEVELFSVCAAVFAAAMIGDERSAFVKERWKYESNSSWSRLYRREQVLSLVTEKNIGFGPFPDGIKFSEDRLFNIAFLEALGREPVEFVPEALYYWDFGESGTCACVSVDDARTLPAFLGKAAVLRDSGFLGEREYGAVCAREFFSQFQRAVRADAALGGVSRKPFLKALSDPAVRVAVAAIPPGCVDGSLVWRFAARLIGCGRFDIAFDVCSRLIGAKSVIKSILH